MASSSTNEAPNAPNSKGAWIGIDLGTSNCTAAVWDISRSRCKVLRLGHENLARPPADGGSGSRKGGKIVPSAVLFRDGDEAGKISGRGIPGLSSQVGYDAIQSFNETKDDADVSDEGSRSSRALVTSFKRVVGMTSRQAKELQSSDAEFWNSLPFQSVIMDADGVGNGEEDGKQPSKDSRGQLDSGCFDVLGDTAIDAAQVQSANQPQSANGVKEGVAISIQPLHTKDPSSNASRKTSEQLVTPLQVTTILLKSIRVAASEHLTNISSNKKSRIHAPGFEDTTQVQNCVIGVPAHYSHAQRSAIQNAAKNAGFAGHVGVMTESTAAAMAYGLFVSPTPSSGDTPKNNDGGKNILVFDMGGGTTDVTIASIDFDETNKVQFRVIATAGDRCLGGDNVDELLARYLWKRHAMSPQAEVLVWKASDHQELIRQCRRAKEELCGNNDDDSKDASGMAQASVTLGGKNIEITREEFDSAILPLIDRAEHVVEDALSTLESHQNLSTIHEVVLVGGSTHVPSVRSMLRRKFPPPIPPELCTSISAETAVAQGLAIQAALVSGSVPLWELRNAMMLDVLPHSIGVWVGRNDSNGSDGGKEAPFAKGQIIESTKNGKQQGHYVQILDKDAPLPAMGNTSFTLASKDQSGVTVIAVEHIGPGDVYQCMGVFDFLLHRLDNKGDANINEQTRQVKIGMVLEESGKFLVSVFDENDPEHREKKRRYLKDKDDNDVPEEGIKHFYEEEERRPTCSGTEIGLVIFCIVLFAVYVAARIAFSDIEMSHLNDEL